MIIDWGLIYHPPTPTIPSSPKRSESVANLQISKNLYICFGELNLNCWWSLFPEMRCCKNKNCKMFPHNVNDALLVAKPFINNSCGFPFDVKL